MEENCQIKKSHRNSFRVKDVGFVVGVLFKTYKCHFSVSQGKGEIYKDTGCSFSKTYIFLHPLLYGFWFVLACERRRISGGRFCRSFSGRETTAVNKYSFAGLIIFANTDNFYVGDAHICPGLKFHDNLWS